MTIDGIGKGGRVGAGATVEGPQAPEAAQGTGKVFDAQRAGGTQATTTANAPHAAEGARAVSVDSQSPLAKLRAGQLDLNGYLDLKVDAATSHLEGLDAAELGAIKRMLRDSLATDPALSDLVRSATGLASADNE